jgi:hypothetical protein
VGPRGWAPLASALVLGPALLAPGIAVLTHGGFPGTVLAAAVAVVCVWLGLSGRRWPALRAFLALTLAGAGYGVAFAFFTPETADGADAARAELPPDPTQLTPTMRSMTRRMPPLNTPALGPRAAAYDLKPIQAHLRELLAVAVDPAGGAALVTRADGSLEHYSYPAFRPQRKEKYRLEQPGYRAALDGRRGRLYVAATDPAALRVNRYGDRPVGRGDLHVYDVGPLLRGRPAGPALHPIAVVPVGGDVSRLLLAPGGDCLYFLQHGPGGDTVGRVSADSLAVDARLRPGGPLAALCLAPDGATLYTAGSSLLVIEPATLKVREHIALEGSFCDLAADNSGRVILAELGQWPLLEALDARRGGHLLGRWRAQIHGRIYLQLSADGDRLYLASSSLVSNSVRGLQIGGDLVSRPQPLGLITSEQGGPNRGEFFMTPDGKFLINHWGKVFTLILDEGGGRPMAPRGAGGVAA